MEEIAVRYFHFLGIIVLSGLLTVEHLLIKPTIDLAAIKKLVIIDRFYGLSAGIVFLSGLALWFWVGKPAEFYNANWVLHLKVSIFLCIALLSLYPTLFILKHRSTSEKSVSVPKAVIWCVRLELLGLLVMPALAVTMAKGVGLG